MTPPFSITAEQMEAAYKERNQVVAALAKCFPSGIAKTAIEGWDVAWHNCVYIDLPTGQVSWHYHDREAELFAGLPPYTKAWDGHSTPEKYDRLQSLQPCQDAGLVEALENAINAVACVRFIYDKHANDSWKCGLSDDLKVVIDALKTYRAAHAKETGGVK